MTRAAPLISLIALAGAWSPLSAQCRLCTTPTTAPSPTDPLSSDDVDLQIESNLNFDRLILSGAGTGAVTIRPDGSTGVEGSVIEASPRSMVGTVLVHGQPNRAVRVDMPRRIELFSMGGGRLTLDDITSDLPAAPRLDASGNLNFRFGGRLILAGDADGAFRGDLSITVEYQ